jgi:hypothetical protein
MYFLFESIVCLKNVNSGQVNPGDFHFALCKFEAEANKVFNAWTRFETKIFVVVFLRKFIIALREKSLRIVTKITKIFANIF